MENTQPAITMDLRALSDDPLMYYATNESLDATTLGLNPTATDKILYVSGGGDQSFAALEFGSRGVAADFSRSHLELATRRAEYLANGDFENFLNPVVANHNSTPEAIQQRNEYFLTGNRLEKMRESVHGLEFIEGNVTDVKGEFDKIYLSNVLSYGGKRYEELAKISTSLSPGGLIYLAHSEGLTSEHLKESGLKVHIGGTKVSRRFEEKNDTVGSLWKPTVLQKL